MQRTSVIRPTGSFFKGLLDGLEVNWNDDLGERLRKPIRGGFSQCGCCRRCRLPTTTRPGWPRTARWSIMPAAGTPEATASLHQFVAEQFAVYSHMPQGAPIHENPPDFDTLIDFHQALSSLNSYPELLRALGLVFDFELPVDFVAHHAD